MICQKSVDLFVINSEALKKYTPSGSQTLSKQKIRFPEVYPDILTYGRAGHVWDGEGKEYIDLISGLGAISVGYTNFSINHEILAQLERGVLFSLPTELEYKVAKRLTELVPGTEMWKFGLNGSDGTVMAVRAARAYTKRTKIMTVGYNGCADVFECRGVRTAGIPEVLKEFNTRATYNDLKSFSDILFGEYACVLMEPMVYEYPKPGFLETLRDACNASGTLLIFDEVVNGGRFQEFYSSGFFKVTPDLYVFSKGIANGVPLCAVGGTRRVMEVFERNDFFASGTFGASCLSLASGLATLNRLESAIPEMVRKGEQIQKAFNSLDWKGEAELIGYPTRLSLKFKDEYKKALFLQEMCLRGVLMAPGANFIMADHTHRDVFIICETIKEAYVSMQTAILKGPVPGTVSIRSSANG